MLGFEELRPRDQGDPGLAEDLHGVGQVSGVWRANSGFGVAHAALRSTSRSRVAMSSGIAAAPSPTFSASSGDQSAAGMITPGLRIDSGSYARLTSRHSAMTSVP